MFALVTGVTLTATLAVGCERQADRVSYNISKQADNFNTIRQITVINCIKGETLFQMTGKMSLKVDAAENQLEVTVEDENGSYKKHFIGLSDNVTYTVEDVTDNYVDNYRYTLNFNPKMWIPAGIETID
ncbi:MAG: hypothetical protein HFK00_08565 [Oscillospiraceae bacterium]|nr:hypothetical protein [Oscillospiraceae bacterium]